MTLVAGRDMVELFEALAQELAEAEPRTTELCVIGGAALNVLGFVERPTKDIDVVALAEQEAGGLRVYAAHVLPEYLIQAVTRVSRQFGIEAAWLNNGPASLMDVGLPGGYESRLVTSEYGRVLRVHYAGRLDQICFKTFAAADVAGRHLTDLLALRPTEEEMEFAFVWVVDHDPSVAFRTQLEGLADYMGVRYVLDAIQG